MPPAAGGATIGAEAAGSSREAFAAHVEAEHDKWSKVIRETGSERD